ncbi:LEAF RUST 10 DISEASE-RESISTANCE LOCUS RECEPTOR-LIKE PROTEIN KINASE-like 2.1 [Gossypium raimondii]|uniref:LEAF RUST 10 DISEASE-RESISTANCE LOCUS RECEPTOR-LIKE PROTEIN KINASE-like 2.1 n=1 Tax=Gossypium raimondii TaxID=29730 RepID=UPI00227CA034|nr:LEAF RUST 10 DISEASE-RESISTANCE LOCUS RECEPTOR-LIKE PROTEIN KINASE-like 2.1 [Gossypium raimondii]
MSIKFLNSGKYCPLGEGFISSYAESHLQFTEGNARPYVDVRPPIKRRRKCLTLHKSDVYSYGMMVLEMVGGRKNINVEVSQTSETYFPSWIYKHLDQSMNLNINEERTKEEEEITKKLIAVSLWCIQTNPLDRPPMAKVMEMLQGSPQLLELPPRQT